MKNNRKIMSEKGERVIGNDEEGSIFLPEAAQRPLVLDNGHFAQFRNCYPAPPNFASGAQVEGKNPLQWYAGGPEQRPEASLERFGNGVNRSKLIAMQNDCAIPTLDLCIAILAWGGMHGSNRNHLFARDVSPWLDVAKRVRAGSLARQQAFDAFASLNLAGSLVGMGPAYYTKLIYFLMPRGGDHSIGYIMDQWLGCSVNLICAQEVVRIDTSINWVSRNYGTIQQAHSRVSPLNTGQHYERFCEAVELVAGKLGEGWTGDKAELALMSAGGRNPEPWRNYVVSRRLEGFVPSLRMNSYEFSGSAPENGSG